MWEEIKNFIKNEIGTQSFNTWFHAVKLEKIDDEKIILQVPNVYYKAHIETHYINLIKKAVFNFTQKNLEIDFSINAQDSLNKNSSVQHSTVFNQKFSFVNFVVGPNNSFAHAVSIAVAESPGYAYNPLFIYGKVGLGKTHLLQAIGYAIQQKYPEKILMYVSCEKFTNELINALQTQTIEKFRSKYRNIDVLLIDDIQFISGKERTQEEFFHTFNHLHNDNKQIVLSSDKPPKEIPMLEERLVSRFEWGITADIQAPDYETRIAILRKKAEKMTAPVPNEVFEFIAANFKSNIRELEGSLTRVVAISSISSRPVTLESTKETLKDSVSLKEKTVSIEDIQRIVSEHFDLTISDLKSQKRSKTLVYPRQIAMYLTRKITSNSFPEIGESFGGKDHSTVIHACEKISEKIENDTIVKNILQKLEEKILG